VTTQPVGPLDDELEDLAAELDDEDHDPAADDEAAGPVEPARFYTGMCEGGPAPYPGKLLVSRFPSGVLLVDSVAARAWVFDLDEAGGLYRCRNDSGSNLDEAGRWRAAEGATYEVRAFDPEFAGDDLPTPADAVCDMAGCDDDRGGAR
jgi:hypothetical protein